MDNPDLFETWRVADKSAYAAERELLRMSLLYYDGNGPTVDQQEMRRVKALRAIANDLFDAAMADVESQTHGARPDSESVRQNR